MYEEIELASVDIVSEEGVSKLLGNDGLDRRA